MPSSSALKMIASSSTSTPDVIIVLGGGRPKSLYEPPIFVKNRCDFAAEVYIHAKEREEKTLPMIVTLSAGTAHTPQAIKENGLPMWEASASAGYIVKKFPGVNPKDILQETTSYDTIGNAYFARAQICDQMPWENIWVVTSDFHAPRSKTIFDWVFSADGGSKKNYRMTYVSTDNVGLTEVEVSARVKREARSMQNVYKLAKKYPTMRDIALFLLRDHNMYSVEGLFKEGEKVSEDVKKSYRS